MPTNPSRKVNSDFTTKENIYFSSLADTIPQIFSIIDPESYQIRFINKVEKGYSIDEVIGNEIFEYILPEYKDLYREKIEEVKKSGKKAIIDVGFLSHVFDEGVTWCQTTIKGIYKKDGSLESILVLSEDITESKRLEIVNNNQSERLKAIINNTRDIICSIDLNNRMIEFNSVFMNIVKKAFGIDLKSGMEILQFIDPTKHQHLGLIYEKVKKGETKIDIESFKKTDGSVVYNETSYHPIYNIENEITGISIFSKDITERIQTEQKIKSTLKEKEILLAEIHHRIKNNLAMVSSMLQLKEMNITNQEAKEALNSSQKRIKTTALIHELLYRNESFHQISLKDFISELFNLLKVNDGVILNLQGDDILFNLNTALPLGLMLNEIILNSFKHTYCDNIPGKTDITIKTDAEWLTVEYCDCKGSFPESIDFQNSSSTGLMLIHTFSEQLNGTIELISKNPPHYKIQIPIHGEN